MALPQLTSREQHSPLEAETLQGKFKNITYAHAHDYAHAHAHEHPQAHSQPHEHPHAHAHASHSSSSRSLGDDQAGIFRAMESSLAGVGVDGRACLLRLICHLQSRPIGQYTVVGEVLTMLFTPKRETNDFLKAYQEAEMAGLDGGDCSRLYPACPFSLPPSLLPAALYEVEEEGRDSSPGHIMSSSTTNTRDLT